MNLLTKLMLILFLISGSSLNPKAQTITTFSPASGPVGTLITITGSNLSNLTSLKIGGVAAIPVSDNGTSLVAMVMPGAITGSVSISTTGSTVTSSSNFSVTATKYPAVQQGNKLAGTGNTGFAGIGNAVAVSADGNTAVVGGSQDNSGVGAVWVFIRTGNTWTQQGNKLVGTGGSNNAQQGWSVGISADGNTVILGGAGDNNGTGAAWIFTRNGTVWSQQGNKLIGTGAIGSAFQGTSVSLSADGNTAVVGGLLDNNGIGAIWVYSRNNGVWAQMGNKLTGTGNTGNSNQGYSVAISSDGKTIIVGGNTDNTSPSSAFGAGAVWIYARNGNSWVQQGSKLVGTGSTAGASSQGYTVALSADGNTAITGGFTDNGSQGAVWIFTRSAGVWSQQGSKLTATGNTGLARLGYSVSISADGNTVVASGPFDNGNQGALWLFTRSGTLWKQQGNKLTGTGNYGSAAIGHAVSLSSDASTAIAGGPNDFNTNGALWVFATGLNSSITATGTLTSFTSCVGSASVAQTITVSGSQLSGNIIITAPSGFELSNSATGKYGAIDTLAQVSGTVASTTVYVRLSNTATGTPAGNIVLTSNGATTQTILVSGTVNALPPTPIITNSRPLSFNNGDSTVLTSSVTTGIQWQIGGANIAGATASKLTVKSSGNYTVTDSNSNGCKSMSAVIVITNIPAPAISSFSPQSAVTGITDTIRGHYFTGAKTVSFGGTAATSFTILNDSTITAIVGNGSSGNLQVTTPSGTGNLAGFIFKKYINLSFTVDITNYLAEGYKVDTGGIRIGGNFADLGSNLPNWMPLSPLCKLTRQGITNKWSITVAVPSASVRKQLLFKFVNTSWGQNEGLEPGSGLIGGSCGLSDGSGDFNRFLNIPTADSVVTYCWDQCSLCNTSATLPTIITGTFGSVTSNSVVLNNNNLTASGGAPVIYAGTIVSLQPLPGFYDNAFWYYYYHSNLTTGSFTDIITNLKPGTTYYVAAFAENVVGVAFGKVYTVTTLPLTPIINGFNNISPCAGTVFTIAGHNFTGATGVSIGSQNVSSFTIVNDSTITAVASQVGSGLIAVISKNVTGYSLVKITINPNPSVPVITSKNNSNLCQGGIDTLVSSFSSSNQWLLNNTIIKSANGTQYPASIAGSYTLSVTNNYGCSSVSGPVNIKVNPIPATPTITASGATTICSGGNVILSSNDSTGNQWYVNGSPIMGKTNKTDTITTAGNYAVLNTSASGCSSALSTATAVTVNSFSPAVTITGSSCSGNLLTLNSNLPLSQILWQRNAVKFAISNDSSFYATSGITVAGGNGIGSSASQLYYPNGVYLDAGGNVYVSDYYNNRVQKWAPGATSGITVAGGHGQGSAANQLNYPQGVFVDAAGNIYVVDMINNRVQKWAAGASAGITVAGGYGAGAGANQLNEPSAVFVDGSSNVFVVDLANNRVQKWTPGATAGVTVAGGNGYGTGANQLRTPSGIYVDQTGNLYIADTYNNRIQKWTPGATVGVTVAGGNGQGAAANQLNYPIGIYLDAKANLFIADNNSRIQRWAPGSASGVTVAGGLTAGGGGNQLSSPSGVYVDGLENIYVADYANNRIQKFTATDSIVKTIKADSAGMYNALVISKTGCTATTVNDQITQSINAPTVTIITNTPTFQICSGTKVNFTANALNAGTPQYQWFKNTIKVGNAGNVYTDSLLNNNDSVWVVVTGNAACFINNTVKSVVLKWTVNQKPAIPIITSKGSTSFCQGLYDILSSSSTTGNQWKLNGTAIAKSSTPQNFVANVSGNYSVTVSNAAGCTATSTVTAITVIPQPAKPIITEDANQNLVSSASTNNQWYSQDEALFGDTGHVYTPWLNGNYTVQAIQRGCISPMSDVFVYNNPNLNKESIRMSGTSTLDSKAVQLYPNPVGNTLKISYQISGIQNVTAEIMDMNGNIIARKESITSGSSIDVSGYASGMYIIRLVNGENQEVLYTTKVIKAK